ncbi:hypothetical protein THIOM_002005 [Candidatus Thiomargarita nelsonii]|uniref:Uncharacterized protein n=1 Tax=Candidatus Thiomargarita nelsonii TaxID=1003181 RepID=A0A0A6NZ44_9GAMM|nr:hypothetical protein THIOM_002005 [Candidatus Thiomargarita nelsonii]
MLVKISDKKKTLISWLEQPKIYIDLYKKIISSATPTTLDVFLKKLSLSTLADQRRIARIKNCLMDIEQKKGEASDILHNIIEFASKQRKDAADENRWCMGDVMRLEEEIKIQKTKVHVVIEACQETIEFVKKNNESHFPDNYLDWTDINFEAAYTDPNLSTEDRVRHQERWRLVIEEIEQEKLIATRISSSEIRRRLSSISEQIYNQLLHSAKRENVLLQERFGLLKLIIEMGDVSRIDHFFGEKIHGSSLQEFASEIKKMEFKIDDVKIDDVKNS